MLRIALLFNLYLISFGCIAHDINIATFQIRHLENQRWIYEVMTPLSNLDRSLRVKNQNAPDADINSIQYKQSIVKYIKQGFAVTAIGYNADAKDSTSEIALQLGQGRIKLNDHLSVLMFEIKGMPEIVSQLDFHFSSMSEFRPANNIFRMIDGDKKQRCFLNQGNNYSGSISRFFKQSR